MHKGRRGAEPFLKLKRIGFCLGCLCFSFLISCRHTEFDDKEVGIVKDLSQSVPISNNGINAAEDGSIKNKASEKGGNDGRSVGEIYEPESGFENESKIGSDSENESKAGEIENDSENESKAGEIENDSENESKAGGSENNSESEAEVRDSENGSESESKAGDSENDSESEAEVGDSENGSEGESEARDSENELEGESEIEEAEEEAESGTEGDTEEEDAGREMVPRLDGLGNWTNYNGIIFGNATIYETTSGGGLAVGGSLTVNQDLAIGSTYSSRYDPTIHIGEYKNENRLPALLYGGDTLQIAGQVHALDVYGGSIAMSENMLAENSEKEVGFTALEGSGYESVPAEELSSWFAHQQNIVTYTSQNLGRGNDVSIDLEELSSGAYLEYGAEYFQNKYFRVNGEVYQNALLITVDTGHDLNFGQWWPIYSILTVDVEWAIDYDLVVFDFPDAVNVTMNSSAFSYQNMSHWSTTVDAWIMERGMTERLAMAEKVVYNFPNARSIEAVQSLIQGSIVAPQATFTGVGAGGNGHIYGHIIARNYVVQGDFSVHAFHLTHWVYDLVNDMLEAEVDTGVINLRNYIYLHGQTTNLRLSGGEYVLVDETGRFFDGKKGFTKEENEAAVYWSSDTENMVISGIPYGSYDLINRKAPAGFLINDKESENSDTYYRTTINLDEENTEVTVRRYSEPIFIDVNFVVQNSTGESGVSGAKFTIVREADSYEDTTIGASYVSGEEGRFISHSLPMGTYRLIETEAPQGYEVVRDGVFWFQVFWNEEQEELQVIDQEQNVVRGTEEDPVLVISSGEHDGISVMVVKYAQKEYESGVLYTLPDAKYHLYRQTAEREWEQLKAGQNDESSELVTNELGYRRIDGLSSGIYRLVEISAPAGYAVDNAYRDEETDSFPDGYAHEFLLASGDTMRTIYLGDLAWNTDLHIQVEGIYQGSRISTPGAAFRLEKKMSQGSSWEELYYRAETDGNGVVTLEGLETGKYRLTQIASGDGYASLTPAIITFEIIFSAGQAEIKAVYADQEVEGETLPVSLVKEEGWKFKIENYAKTVDYEIYKIDADYMLNEDETSFSITYLEGAQFRLRRRLSPRAEWVDYGGVFISEFQYDNSGNPILDGYGNHITKAVFEGGLMFGEYQLVETKPPEGYMTGSEIEVAFADGTSGRQIHLFSVTENMTGTNQVSQYTAADYSIDYSTNFVFYKVNSDNVFLPRAEFALYRCDQSHEHDADFSDSSCWAQATPILERSNRSGQVSIEQLSSGSYLMLETRAPVGYQLSPGQWRIEINAPAAAVTIWEQNGAPAMQEIYRDDEILYFLPNQEKWYLPFTGGSGRRIYFILGTGILAVGILLLAGLRARITCKD